MTTVNMGAWGRFCLSGKPFSMKHMSLPQFLRLHIIKKFRGNRICIL